MALRNNLCHPYCSPSIIRVMTASRMRWTELVVRMTAAYEVKVEKPEGKRLLGRCRMRWEDSSQMDHSRMKIWAPIIWFRWDRTL